MFPSIGIAAIQKFWFFYDFEEEMMINDQIGLLITFVYLLCIYLQSTGRTQFHCVIVSIQKSKYIIYKNKK